VELFPEGVSSSGPPRVYLCRKCIRELPLLPQRFSTAVSIRLTEAHYEHEKKAGYSVTFDPTTGDETEHGTPPAWWKDAETHAVTIYYSHGAGPLPWQVTEKRGDVETIQ
jgi:hypothetical protein